MVSGGAESAEGGEVIDFVVGEPLLDEGCETAEIGNLELLGEPETGGLGGVVSAASLERRDMLGIAVHEVEGEGGEVADYLVDTAHEGDDVGGGGVPFVAGVGLGSDDL